MGRRRRGAERRGRAESRRGEAAIVRDAEETKRMGGNPLKWVDEDEGVKRKKIEKKGREDSSDDEEDLHDDGLPPITGPSVLDARRRRTPKSCSTAATATTTSGDTGSDAAGDAARIETERDVRDVRVHAESDVRGDSFLLLLLVGGVLLLGLVVVARERLDDGCGWCTRTCPRRCAST